jgi:hypothetical protein
LAFEAPFAALADGVAGRELFLVGIFPDLELLDLLETAAGKLEVAGGRRLHWKEGGRWLQVRGEDVGVFEGVALH